MEGIEQINFEDVDCNTATEDAHCIDTKFVVEQPDEIVYLPI